MATSLGPFMFQRQRIPTYRTWWGAPQATMVRPHRATNQLVHRTRKRAESLQQLSADALLQASDGLRDRVGQGESVLHVDVAAESFALMNEALRRVHGIQYYDVQLSGGFALASGAIAEIQTGEGKTITTALPAFLHSLAGRGVHVATTNEYLSQRDCEELADAFQLLGASVGQLVPQAAPHEKREAYRQDITYGPGYEFGFDFLRDQLTLRSRAQSPLGARHLNRLAGGRTQDDAPLIQRELAFLIVDEADSVLIDEAATPLILSGITDSACTAPESYRRAMRLVEKLTADLDFEYNRAAKTVQLTREGWQRIHDALPSRQDENQLARPWSKVVENAIKAQHIMRRDVDYVVQDDEVVLVDQNTGRLHPERTWRGGLHQAVETLEGLEPSPEKETQARITRQNFCNRYDGICGLTGTALGGESEFREFYSLPVVQISTHRPCQRKELPARFFANEHEKIDAIASDVAARINEGRPVLIGTRTIEISHKISAALTSRRVGHTVLNGVQDESESDIVRLAGQANRVTVATNMAGRGTDIRLTDEVRQAGGLHVVASEFHESRRIDRQLAGRAARQGDPGSCQFYAAADDELLKHAPSLAQRIEQQPSVDHTDRIRHLQSQLDHHGLISRRRMVRHDQWMESVQSSLARQTN